MKRTGEMSVKGSIFMDLVNVVQGMKEIPWDEYLSQEARDLASQKILPSLWYPAEPALEIMWIAYKLLGNSNPQVAKEWGRSIGGRVFEQIYKTLFTGASDPAEVLRKFDIIATKSLFRGLESETIEIDERHFLVRVVDDDPRTEPAYYFIQGCEEILVEKSGGKNCRVEIIEKHWEGADATLIDIQWE